MLADLVCKGGGVKGIALIGAICYLEEKGYKWQKIAGTSAGAIVGSLIAVGYTGLELKEILINTNYKDFNSKNHLQGIPLIGQPLSLITQKGIYTADGVENFLINHYNAKGKVKFKDISTNGISKLKVLTVDVTTHELLILPDDLVKFNIDPLEFEISKAVRMSMSIPFYYTPSILKKNGINNYLVDGGLLSNFPIWIFDVPRVPRWPTFGLKLLSDSDVTTPPSRNNIINYVGDIVETLLDKNEDVYLYNKDSVRTIDIPTLGVKVTDFNLSREKAEELFNSGYNSAKDFLATWDFDAYRNIYRR